MCDVGTDHERKRMSESKLHRWTQRDGAEWACAAYDHGPLCRLCTRVDPDDETLRAMLQHVENGNMTVQTGSDGELLFKMTDKGNEAARVLIESLGADPDDEDETFAALRRRDIAESN